jgi:hypothetical protein
MSNLDHSLQAAADFGELHHLRLEPLTERTDPQPAPGPD